MASARDMWLKDHEECVQLGQDVMVAINCRNKHPKGSSGYLKESATIRTTMRQFSAKFNSLRNDLVSTNMRYSMTQRELERRQILLDDLYTKEKQLEEAIKGDRPSALAGRSALMDPVANLGPFNSGDPWGVAQDSGSQASDPYADLSFDGIRQQQHQAIREQDEGLEALSHVLHRQKNMALDIGNEVDVHNELLDDITEHTERADQHLIRETRHIQIIDRKSNTCSVAQQICDLHRDGYNALYIKHVLRVEMGVEISYSYLAKKVLPNLGLCRKGRQVSTLEEIVAAYEAEAATVELNELSAKDVVRLLRTVYHLNLSRRHAEIMNQIFQPDLVAERRRGCLHRRVYHSVGPNYIWHIDGYDKLAPYGLPVHGAICGFSRYLIWLEACVSNRNPLQTAVFYCDAVQTFGAPYTIRIDNGTENRNIGLAHQFIWDNQPRRNELPAVLRGSSNHNERIERYWGTLRLKHVNRWRKYFQQLVREGILVCWDNIDRFVVAYCFLAIVQRTLQYIMHAHNNSLIRSQRNADIPTGRPRIMYISPEIYGYWVVAILLFLAIIVIVAVPYNGKV